MKKKVLLISLISVVTVAAIAVATVFIVKGIKNKRQTPTEEPIVAEPITETLATPKNLIVSDGVLSWDTVEHATSYLVYVNDNEYVVNTNKYDLGEVTGKVKLAVIAEGKGYLPSAKSAVIVYCATVDEAEVEKANSSLQTFMQTNDIVTSDTDIRDLSVSLHKVGLDAKDVDALCVALQEIIDGLAEIDQFNMKEECSQKILSGIQVLVDSKILEYSLVEGTRTLSVYFLSKKADTLEANLSQNVASRRLLQRGSYFEGVETPYYSEQELIQSLRSTSTVLADLTPLKVQNVTYVLTFARQYENTIQSIINFFANNKLEDESLYAQFVNLHLFSSLMNIMPSSADYDLLMVTLESIFDALLPSSLKDSVSFDSTKDILINIYSANHQLLSFLNSLSEKDVKDLFAYTNRIVDSIQKNTDLVSEFETTYNFIYNNKDDLPKKLYEDAISILYEQLEELIAEYPIYGDIYSTVLSLMEYQYSEESTLKQNVMALLNVLYENNPQICQIIVASLAGLNEQYPIYGELLDCLKEWTEIVSEFEETLDFFNTYKENLPNKLLEDSKDILYEQLEELIVEYPIYGDIRSTVLSLMEYQYSEELTAEQNMMAILNLLYENNPQARQIIMDKVASVREQYPMYDEIAKLITGFKNYRFDDDSNIFTILGTLSEDAPISCNIIITKLFKFMGQYPIYLSLLADIMDYPQDEEELVPFVEKLLHTLGLDEYVDMAKDDIGVLKEYLIGLIPEMIIDPANHEEELVDFLVACHFEDTLTFDKEAFYLDLDQIDLVALVNDEIAIEDLFASFDLISYFSIDEELLWNNINEAISLYMPTLYQFISVVAEESFEALVDEIGLSFPKKETFEGIQKHLEEEFGLVDGANPLKDFFEDIANEFKKELGLANGSNVLKDLVNDILNELAKEVGFSKESNVLNYFVGGIEAKLEEYVAENIPLVLRVSTLYKYISNAIKEEFEGKEQPLSKEDLIDAIQKHLEEFGFVGGSNPFQLVFDSIVDDLTKSLGFSDDSNVLNYFVDGVKAKLEQYVTDNVPLVYRVPELIQFAHDINEYKDNPSTNAVVTLIPQLQELNVDYLAVYKLYDLLDNRYAKFLSKYEAPYANGLDINYLSLADVAFNSVGYFYIGTDLLYAKELIAKSISIGYEASDICEAAEDLAVSLMDLVQELEAMLSQDNAETLLGGLNSVANKLEIVYEKYNALKQLIGLDDVKEVTDLVFELVDGYFPVILQYKEKIDMVIEWLETYDEYLMSLPAHVDTACEYVQQKVELIKSFVGEIEEPTLSLKENLEQLQSVLTSSELLEAIMDGAISEQLSLIVEDIKALYDEAQHLMEVDEVKELTDLISEFVNGHFPVILQYKEKIDMVIEWLEIYDEYLMSLPTYVDTACEYVQQKVELINSMVEYLSNNVASYMSASEADKLSTIESFLKAVETKEYLQSLYDREMLGYIVSALKMLLKDTEFVSKIENILDSVDKELLKWDAEEEYYSDCVDKYIIKYVNIVFAIKSFVGEIEEPTLSLKENLEQLQSILTSSELLEAIMDGAISEQLSLIVEDINDLYDEVIELVAIEGVAEIVEYISDYASAMNLSLDNLYELVEVVYDLVERGASYCDKVQMAIEFINNYVEAVQDLFEQSDAILAPIVDFLSYSLLPVYFEADDSELIASLTEFLLNEDTKQEIEALYNREILMQIGADLDLIYQFLVPNNHSIDFVKSIEEVCSKIEAELEAWNTPESMIYESRIATIMFPLEMVADFKVSIEQIIVGALELDAIISDPDATLADFNAALADLQTAVEEFFNSFEYELCIGIIDNLFGIEMYEVETREEPFATLLAYEMDEDTWVELRIAWDIKEAIEITFEYGNIKIDIEQLKEMYLYDIFASFNSFVMLLENELVVDIVREPFAFADEMISYLELTDHIMAMLIDGIPGCQTILETYTLEQALSGEMLTLMFEEFKTLQFDDYSEFTEKEWFYVYSISFIPSLILDSEDEEYDEKVADMPEIWQQFFIKDPTSPEGMMQITAILQTLQELELEDIIADYIVTPVKEEVNELVAYVVLPRLELLLDMDIRSMIDEYLNDEEKAYLADWNFEALKQCLCDRLEGIVLSELFEQYIYENIEYAYQSIPFEYVYKALVKAFLYVLPDCMGPQLEP